MSVPASLIGPVLAGLPGVAIAGGMLLKDNTDADEKQRVEA